MDRGIRDPSAFTIISQLDHLTVILPLLQRRYALLEGLLLRISDKYHVLRLLADPTEGRPSRQLGLCICKLALAAA